MCGGREMSELGAWSSTGLPPAPIKPWYSSRARTNQGILKMRAKKTHRQGKDKGCPKMMLVLNILPTTNTYRQVSVLLAQYWLEVTPWYFNI